MFLRFRRPTPTADLAEGATAIVEGKITAKSEVAVPEGGPKCVWYDALFEAFSSGSRGGRLLWMPERSEAKCAGFFVEDAAGKVWVPEDAAQHFDVRGAKRASGPVGKDGTKRYVAHYLQAGDTVRLQGRVTKATGRKEPPGVRVLRPLEGGKLVVLVR
jgi:hypothetical protein